MHSQSHLAQLLLGQVQRVVEGSDPEELRVSTGGQVGPQDPVVHHVDERPDAVPALIIEPDLREDKESFIDPDVGSKQRPGVARPRS